MSSIAWFCFALALAMWFLTGAEDTTVGLIFIIILICVGVAYF
jgi:hypothetical protein